MLVCFFLIKLNFSYQTEIILYLYNLLLNGQLLCTSGGKNTRFSRAMTLHSLIDLFYVCCLGMLSGCVYNAACSTSQIRDCMAVVRDYWSALSVFHLIAVSENKTKQKQIPSASGRKDHVTYIYRTHIYLYDVFFFILSP